LKTRKGLNCQMMMMMMIHGDTDDCMIVAPIVFISFIVY